MTSASAIKTLETVCKGVFVVVFIGLGGCIFEWDQSDSEQDDGQREAESDALRRADAALTPDIQHVDGDNCQERQQASDNH
jgi:hypothetical protein